MPSRRQINHVAVLAGAATFLRPFRPARAASLAIGLLLPGRRDDGGFMEAGFIGFEASRVALGASTTVIDGVPPRPDELAAALRRLAEGGAGIVVAHGGQCDGAAMRVSAQFPAVQFLVIQGAVEGPNLTSYEVLQEQSAWLAGAAAALLTRTGTVAHLSGIRVPPGLKGRAGFAAGLRHVRPDVRLLTTFCGEQDDPALAARAVSAQAEAGADIVFTMLNAGRTGAIEACRQRGVRQIGNVRDWTVVAPDVFVASAIADVGVAMQEAVTDAATGRLVSGRHRRLGVSSGDAVRLALSPDVPAAVRAAVGRFAAELATGAIEVPTTYDGPDFAI